MKILALVALACVVAPGWAGMAFPSASKKYVINLFKSVNPNIEWDTTNYVVDLSGYHAQCDHATGEGVQFENTRTRNGEIITVVQDSGPTEAAHVNAVNAAIPPIMDDWPAKYKTHINNAEKFGCSVEPSCDGRMSIACLFAPSVLDVGTEDKKEGNEDFGPNPGARAFTPEQYSLSEKITGTSWDRDHFLENLSGYDIDCDMIGANDWDYKKASKIAGDRKMTIKGSFGSSQNLGETEPAMSAILKGLYKPPSSMVGCSVIPDCMKDGAMYVVASCVFET